MSGKLMNMARNTALKINKAIGWETDIKLSNPDRSLSVNLKGIHTKHHLSFDESGQRVNAKNAHVLIAEKDLLKHRYPYRNKTGNIALIGHFIDVEDCKFIINETYPSETFGLIVCILGDINAKTGTHGGFNRGTNTFR